MKQKFVSDIHNTESMFQFIKNISGFFGEPR